MKLLNVVISFALVYVFAAAIDPYEEEVIKTNLQLKELMDRQREFVIRLAIIEDFTMEQLTLILVVPERPVETIKELENLTQQEKSEMLQSFQVKMQTIILQTTGTKPTETIDSSSYGGDSLQELGEKRRGLTHPVILNFIRYMESGDTAFSVNCTNGSRNRCRLYGLTMMFDNPTTYIVSADVDSADEETCIIKDVNEKETRL